MRLFYSPQGLVLILWMRRGRGTQHNTCQVVGLLPDSAWILLSDFPLIFEPEPHDIGAERLGSWFRAWTSRSLIGFPYPSTQRLRESYRPVREDIPVCSSPGTRKCFKNPVISPLFAFHFQRPSSPCPPFLPIFSPGRIVGSCFSHPILALSVLASWLI